MHDDVCSLVEIEQKTQFPPFVIKRKRQKKQRLHAERNKMYSNKKYHNRLVENVIELHKITKNYSYLLSVE